MNNMILFLAVMSEQVHRLLKEKSLHCCVSDIVYVTQALVFV